MRLARDEELAAIGIWAGAISIRSVPAHTYVEVGGGGGVLRHGKDPRLVVLDYKVLVRKLVRAVDGSATSSIAVQEIAALDPARD